MSKLKLSALFFLAAGWITAATVPGQYAVLDDVTVQVLTENTVSGAMVLKKGRQFQVTGQEGEYILVQLGRGIKGRIIRYQENRILPLTDENAQELAKASATAKEETPKQATSPEPPAPKPVGALAIKGVYIGMPAEEAVRVLNANKPVRLQVSYLRTENGRVSYQISYDANSQPDSPSWGYGGILYANLKTRKVDDLIIYGELADPLFNTGDLSGSSFAKRLIDSYGIPELKSVVKNGESLWHYESPYGWSIYVTPNKTIELFQTPQRQFD